MTLTLLPAIDLLGGRAAQLVQGVQGTGSAYGDPVEVAERFAAEGARWLHVVDLDAAFGEAEDNREVIARIVTAVAPIPVQAGGGVRSDQDLEDVLALGVERVVLGTAALDQAAWVRDAYRRHGARLVVSLDVAGTELRSRGWTRAAGELLTTLARLEQKGCRRFVFTEVSRDGTLSGPSLAGLRLVLEATALPVIASGGVGNVDDLRALAALAPLGLEGVIVGTALYEGRLSVAGALAALEEAAG